MVTLSGILSSTLNLGVETVRQIDRAFIEGLKSSTQDLSPSDDPAPSARWIKADEALRARLSEHAALKNEREALKTQVIGYFFGLAISCAFLLQAVLALPLGIGLGTICAYHAWTSAYLYLPKARECTVAGQRVANAREHLSVVEKEEADAARTLRQVKKEADARKKAAAALFEPGASHPQGAAGFPTPAPPTAPAAAGTPASFWSWFGRQPTRAQ